MRRGLRNAGDRAAKIAIGVTTALFTVVALLCINTNSRLGWTCQSDKAPARITP
jgi:hypothetical protein